MQGGYLSGNGTIEGDVQNTGGSVAPGTSLGLLTIDGTYDQGGGGTLEIEVASTDPEDIDQFVITGAASYAGTLSFLCIDSFEPALEDSFIVTHSDTITGVFDTIDFPTVPGDLGVAVQYNEHDILVWVNMPWLDVTTGALGDGAVGQAVAWGDYDDDWDPDLYITNRGGANKLFRNDGDGGFTDVTSSPLDDVGDARGAAWGDYDNDGDLDLYLVNDLGGANKLFRNDGDDLFVDVTSGPLGDTGDGQAAAWSDYDNDGDIDLYLTNKSSGNKLLRNDLGDVFTDVTTGPLGDPLASTGAAWADYDDDGDLDLYVVNGAGGANKLIRNDLDVSTFVDVTAPPLDDTGDGTAAAWADYDGDLDLDLYVANLGGANKLFRNDGGGVFVDVTAGPIGDTGNTSGAVWADYDNDGDLDLYLANEAEDRLLRNDTGGVFTDVSSDEIADPTRNSAGVGWADYDGDLDLDLYIANASGENVLLRNLISNAKNRVGFDLNGTISNAAAIGARVLISIDDVWQIREVSGGNFLSQNSPLVEFGMGTATIIDSIIVQWPSGYVDADGSFYPNNGFVMIEGYGVVGVDSEMETEVITPTRYALHAAYPNPFNPTTTVEFELPKDSPVRLYVFDVTGRWVRSLADQGNYRAGFHRVIWDGQDDAGRSVGSGVYFYRLEAGAFDQTRRVILLK